MGPSALSTAHAEIARNGAVLSALEAHVEATLAAGDPASAAGWAQIAARFAATNHPGRFSSPRLERALRTISGLVAAPAQPRSREVRRVLHVLTEGYETGGHTRLAWRWMQRDATRHHEVALTCLRVPVPAPLREAAAAVHELDGDGPIAVAAQLRALAGGFDLVVLHVHMFDVVPCIAFGTRDDGPAVVFVDHADHLFWIGVGVADVVTACRAPAIELQVTRRGIGRDRCVLLPVPTDVGGRVHTRERARELLGLARERPVLLSIAAPHKFAPLGDGPSFADAADAALRACPDAALVAVGPTAGDPGWPQLAGAHPGRVVCAGMQSDLQPFWDAADVYVDSYPFSSNTSAIEAATHGLPVVSFAPDPEQQGLLLTHDPGFEDDLVRAATPEEYGRAVAEVLRDPHEVGERVRAGSVAAHAGDGWRAHLENVVARAVAVVPAPLPPNADGGPVADWEAIHHILFRATDATTPLAACIVDQAAALPPPERPHTRRDLARLAHWTGVAAVGADAGRVASVVATLRELLAADLLDRCVVAVPPGEVDAAVPLLEAALERGGDFALDLVPTDDPTEAAPGARTLIL